MLRICDLLVWVKSFRGKFILHPMACAPVLLQHTCETHNCRKFFTLKCSFFTDTRPVRAHVCSHVIDTDEILIARVKLYVHVCTKLLLKY